MTAPVNEPSLLPPGPLSAIVLLPNDSTDPPSNALTPTVAFWVTSFADIRAAALEPLTSTPVLVLSVIEFPATSAVCVEFTPEADVASAQSPAKLNPESKPNEPS